MLVPLVVILGAAIAIYVIFPVEVQNVTGILSFPVYPVAGVAPKVTQPFRGAEHGGIDLRAPLGSAVVSPAPGRVVTVHDADDTKAGLFVIMQGTGQFIGMGWGFAHLSKIEVVKGQELQAGDLVGLSGNTDGPDDRSTGPHLHFTALKVPGFTFIDPTPFLRDHLPSEGDGQS